MRIMFKDHHDGKLVVQEITSAYICNHIALESGEDTMQTLETGDQDVLCLDCVEGNHIYVIGYGYIFERILEQLGKNGYVDLRYSNLEAFIDPEEEERQEIQKVLLQHVERNFSGSLNEYKKQMNNLRGEVIE